LLAVLIKIFVLRGFYLSAHSLVLQTGKSGLHRVAESRVWLGTVLLVHLDRLALAEIAGGLIFIGHSVEIAEVVGGILDIGVCE